MQKFCVTTDSGCDLPLSLCNEKEIYPLQLTYLIDNEIYTDSMLHEDCKIFYDKMRQGAVPKTSQVNTNQFLKFWETLLPKNLPIVHICLGGKISGTYTNGLIARDMFLEQNPDAKLYVVDSTLASVGYGMLALEAAKMRDDGKEPEECLAWIEENKININTYYTTDNLTYLYRSGRVSKIGAIVGNALNINPILRLNSEGRLLVAEKVHGRKATIKRIHAIVQDTLTDPGEQTLYVCHSDIYEEAKKFGDEIRDMFGFKDVYYTYIGPTIGTHAGPGLMAAFYFGTPRVM
jgi:DegV family protein with EDD domain